MKHWFQSRLIWLGNFLMASGVFLLWAQDNGYMDQILSVLPEGVFGYVSSAVGFLVIYLRYKTTTGIGKDDPNRLS